jgi:hypothetical protein
MFSTQTGIDTTNLNILNNNAFFVSSGSIIESNGSLFKLTGNFTIPIPDVNKDYFIYIHDNGNGTANFNLTNVYPVFNISKNGFYTSSNERVLNTFYMRKTLVKKDENGENIDPITFIDLDYKDTIGTLLLNIVSGIFYSAFPQAAATLGDGSVLIYSFSSVYKYYNDGSYIELPKPTSRYAAAGASLGDGSVLFAGGTKPDVEKYDVNGVRTTLTSLSNIRTGLAAATLGDGSVLFAGGQGNDDTGGTQVFSIVEKYDKNGVKSTFENLASPKEFLAAATLGDGSVLFAGGYKTDNNGTSIIYSETVEKYDVNGVRTTLSSLSQAKTYLKGATLGDGSVLFAGGANSLGVCSSVDKYDKNGVKSIVQDLISPREHHAMSTYGDGSVLVIGGALASATNPNPYAPSYIERYDINGVRTSETYISDTLWNVTSATLGNGSVLFGSSGGGMNEYIYRIFSEVNLNLSYGSKYRFEDDTEEKVVFSDVTKTIPNKGYVKYNAVVTI